MTYSTGVPDTNQSPFAFPAQGSGNFTRLKTLLGANHKFNDSAAGDDGYHQNISILPIAAPGHNGEGAGQHYIDTADTKGNEYFRSPVDKVYQITPCLPMHAAAVFSGAGTTLGPYTGSTALNCTVSGPTASVYTITFTAGFAPPSANYLAFITAAPSIATSCTPIITSKTIAAMSFYFVNGNNGTVTSGSISSVSVAVFGG